VNACECVERLTDPPHRVRSVNWSWTQDLVKRPQPDGALMEKSAHSLFTAVAKETKIISSE